MKKKTLSKLRKKLSKPGLLEVTRECFKHRVGRGVAAPFPSQTRACASNALGSSRVSFAHVAYIDRTTSLYVRGVVAIFEFSIFKNLNS